MVDWDAYLELHRSTEALLESAERLMDGASEERPDDWGLGRSVWASDFDALKLQVEATRTVLRDAPTTKEAKG